MKARGELFGGNRSWVKSELGKKRKIDEQKGS